MEPGAEALPCSFYVVSPKGIYHETTEVLNLISGVNCHSGASDFTINIEMLEHQDESLQP